jgi:hypothetical protein
MYCKKCGEPWDTYHLRHEVWFDMDVSGTRALQEAYAYNSTGRISDFARRELRGAGWEFGDSVFAILHCPGCPEGTKAVPRACVETEDVLAEALGNDLDGLEAELSDLEDLL